ncbi:GroES-like protein [Aspergillus sclerotiicarbonarius CBS 121057]|uniref:GroES-like protein n=1 Tax=Aspergillus sclerotiicarbonarius (strain CBS 121057 / IBT 28362) TaxID=1448318 RepID=A0A319DX27_ASPSB|nr:GroES-like protein [Aspergillus sclerotiicarbonarius CBS 121057]
MKEAFVDKNISLTIRDTDIPVPGPGQVLIRVVVSGTNPKDWKMPPLWPTDGTPANQGDDIAGYIEAVGEGVMAFHKGDKVAAFHQVMTPHGSWAEYAIAHDYTTFHIPAKTSFEEAATIPLAAMTAALGLYQRLKLPLPWNPTTEPLPLIVYGGATAVGAFAIKLARLSNIHPLITVAGKGSAFVETLIDREKGDTVIDYREGDEVVRAKIQEAAWGRSIHYAYDAVGEHGSHQNLGAVMTVPGEVTTMELLPSSIYQPPEGITMSWTIAGSVHFPPAAGKTVEDAEFGAALFQFIGRGLAQGWFKGHPFEVRPGGLAGLEGALHDLRAGKASAVKYVVRIGETEGVNP